MRSHFVVLKRGKYGDVKFGPEPAKTAFARTRLMMRTYGLESEHVVVDGTPDTVTVVVDARSFYEPATVREAV